MLNKLLKYDLKYMVKNMSVFYILAIFFSILTRIFFSCRQTIIVNLVGQISAGVVISMLASILFNTIIRSWVRFRDSIYKDESYLTHTLPVSKFQIYESRFLQSIIFTLIGFAVIIVSLFITYYTKERWISLKALTNSISSGLNLNTSFVVISIVAIFFLEVINLIQSGFLGLVIGYNKDNNKIVHSFVFGFICYMLSQMFVALVIFIFGIFDSNIMSIFNSTIIDSNTIKIIIILSIFIYMFAITVMNVICNYIFKKGVNVD